MGASECMLVKLKKQIQDYAGSFLRYACIKMEENKLQFYIVKKDCTIEGDEETVYTVQKSEEAEKERV
jgi:hypothetical protein